MKRKIIDAIFSKIKISFVIIVDLYKLVKTLKVKILYIANLNHRCIISMPIEEVSNKI